MSISPTELGVFNENTVGFVGARNQVVRAFSHRFMLPLSYGLLWLTVVYITNPSLPNSSGFEPLFLCSGITYCSDHDVLSLSRYFWK